MWRNRGSGGRARIGECGGIEAVVAAMRSHSANLDIQSNGCSVLLNLALDIDANARIGGCGGVEVVVAAMCAHLADSDVQYFRCGAILNLAVNNSANKARIREYGGIEAAVAAMQSQPS